MVIEPGNSGINKGNVNAPVSGKRSGAAEDGASSGQSVAASHDSVSLSNQAHALGRLEQAIQSSPDVNEAKVEALKQAVADGSYQMDSGSIADKMLAGDSLF